MAELRVKSGPQTGQRFQIDEMATIGRSQERLINQDNYLLLNDAEISRQHLRIFSDENSYYVEDLNSTNGSVLRGITLQPGVAYAINDGDELILGQSLIAFHQGYSGFHMPEKPSSKPNPNPSTLDLDIDAFHTGTRAATAVRVMGEHEHQPDVSMIVDASQIIQELRGQSGLLHDRTELLTRMQAMIQVSIALGAITDQNKLLPKIIECVFELFKGADRCFIIACNKDNDQFLPLIVRNRDETKQEVENIALSKTIIREVLEQKHALLLVDALGDEHFGVQESIVNLAIRGVMCAPLLYEDEVLGLIQVDNQSGRYAFHNEDLEILTAISAQVAISMKNSQLYQDIENLFEGFVRASVQAIEARDPTTAGHSFRVADYTENLAMAVDRADEHALADVNFSREQLQEIRYAALLHDFGKVGVREHVLTKAKKLYPHEISQLRQRFQYARALMERQAYYDLVQLHEQNNMNLSDFVEQKQLIEQELQHEVARLNSFLQTILEVNEPEHTCDGQHDTLEKVMGYSFIDHNDDEINLLNKFEFSVLTESRGSLNPKERKEIESHVSHTFDFLSLIPWTSKFAGIPDIAHAHHEKLDGTGYPQGLQAQAIPVQSKIMAIADIYDALTAGDRPYRDGVNTDAALNIIDEQVRAGKLDSKLFEIFVESDSYKPSGRNNQ